MSSGWTLGEHGHWRKFRPEKGILVLLIPGKLEQRAKNGATVGWAVLGPKFANNIFSQHPTKIGKYI